MPLERISEVLKRRGVKRVVHFHTDHFEPWRPFPGRDNDPAASIAAVERFVEMSGRVELTRRQTLFYKGLVNYDLSDSRELHRADPDDRLGFLPETEQDAASNRHVLQALDGAGHELQLHIHHENFNFTTREPEDETQRYLAEDGWRHDAARLELAIRLNLDTMRRACGKPDAVWFFVHGHWALNASDVRECTVVREIEMLMRNGCAGDFTFPAGRDHVDPHAEVPFLVRPVAQPMGYDRREAGAVQAWGAGQTARDRFFIWQTPQRHRLCSLDYYSPFVRKRFEDPAAAALALAETGCVLGDTLYHKTHAHSLHPRYWETDPNPFPPLLHPGAQMELGMLFDGAQRAGANVAFSTAGAVYREVTGAASVPTTPPQGVADPMAGRESIRFIDALGNPAEAAPLHPHITAIPAPIVRTPRAPGGIEPPRPLPVEARVIMPTVDNPTARPDLGGLADRIDAIAAEVALKRSADLGPGASGVTGFYATRAQEGAMLSPAERRLAEHVLATAGVTRAYEIGSGLGVLSALLAASGVETVAIERHGGRHETAGEILNAVAAAYPAAAGKVQPVKGKFPLVSEFDLGLDRSAALLTNLLGGADFEEQSQVIRGLRPFKYAFVDLSKFYERRPDAARQRELIRLFRVAGFNEPRELFDLGDDGRYVLFINPSPLGSSLPEVLFRRARRSLTRSFRQMRRK